MHPASPGVPQDGRFALRRRGGRGKREGGALCRLSSVPAGCAASSLPPPPPGSGYRRSLALLAAASSPPHRSALLRHVPGGGGARPGKAGSGPSSLSPLRGSVTAASAAHRAGERRRAGIARGAAEALCRLLPTMRGALGAGSWRAVPPPLPRTGLCRPRLML